MLIIPVGVIYFILYYVIFSFLIKKMNLKTPGREDDDTETKLFTKPITRQSRAQREVLREAPLEAGKTAETQRVH